MNKLLIGMVLLFMPGVVLAKNNSSAVVCNTKQISENIKGKNYTSLDSFTSLIIVDLENISYYSKNNKSSCASAVRHELSETAGKAYIEHLNKISDPVQKKAFSETYSIFSKAINPDLSFEKYESLVTEYYDSAFKFNNMRTPSKWVEHVLKDEMRGTITHVYSLKSNESQRLSSPYKETKAEIIVFQKEVAGGFDRASYMISIDDGQLSYPINDATVMARFDNEANNGDVSEFGGAICDDKNRLFCLDSYAQIEMAISINSSKHAIMELQFFNDGPKQFHFDVAGLPLKRAIH